MPNQLHLTVENPDEIRNAGAYDTGALMRVQSSATEAGAFVDLTGTGSTPTIAVLAATRSYVGYDPAGASSTWYRTRFENAGGTRTSDWSAAFQAGAETGGLICSVYDVEQRLDTVLDANDREMVIDLIRGVTVAIEGFTGRWFIPRPLSGERTYRLNTSRGYELRLPRGIRSVSTLNVAYTDQPATGGTYTAVAATGYVIAPSEFERDAGWPGTRLCLLLSAGAVFADAINGAEVTGEFGWVDVPADIQAIGADAVVRKWIGKETAAPAVSVGPTGAVTILRGLSPEATATLEWYRVIPTA